MGVHTLSRGCEPRLLQLYHTDTIMLMVNVDPVVEVDVLAFAIRHEVLHVLLVRRALPPFARDWALPGVRLGPDERLFFASCSVAGKLDPRVVAIVVDEPNVTTFTKVRQAWRANIDRGEFELIPVTGITCEETGGG